MDESTVPETTSKLPAGMILPPPEIKVSSCPSDLERPQMTPLQAIVEKTAAHIAKKDDSVALEAKIRLRGAADPRFSFLRPDDAYYPFYQYQLQLVRTGGAAADTSASMDLDKTTAADAPDDGRPKIPEPAPYEFLTPMPPINTVDLCAARSFAAEFALITLSTGTFFD